jgi:hypothetical protein
MQFCPLLFIFNDLQATLAANMIPAGPGLFFLQHQCSGIKIVVSAATLID